MRATKTIKIGYHDLEFFRILPNVMYSKYLNEILSEKSVSEKAHQLYSGEYDLECERARFMAREMSAPFERLAAELDKDRYGKDLEQQRKDSSNILMKVMELGMDDDAKDN